MSGHVFHPGHEELHGVTVVVEGTDGRTWVGRYHERTDRGVLLHDVAVHDPAADTNPKQAWLDRVLKFGVSPTAKVLVIPPEDITRLIRLTELSAP